MTQPIKSRVGDCHLQTEGPVGGCVVLWEVPGITPLCAMVFATSAEALAWLDDYIDDEEEQQFPSRLFELGRELSLEKVEFEEPQPPKKRRRFKVRGPEGTSDGR